MLLMPNHAPDAFIEWNTQDGWPVHQQPCLNGAVVLVFRLIRKRQETIIDIRSACGTIQIRPGN